MTVIVGLLILELDIPGCSSLKEKRSRIKPLLARLHREFNVSTAELAHLDAWSRTIIGCTVLSNDGVQVTRVLQQVTEWIEDNWADMQVIDNRIELR
jgi:hypothetical protein